MNASQRRKDKRSRIRLAGQLVEIMLTALDEIESGKYTIPEVREQANEMKRELAKA